jgi:RimJ/RimL family protein N-acetyltransferase
VPTLETERLVLRSLTDDDLDAFAAIVADPEVQRFMSGPMDRAQAWRQLALFRGHEALRGWSQNAVVERETGRLVGRAGLWRPEGWPGLEVGWGDSYRETRWVFNGDFLIYGQTSPAVTSAAG